MEATINTLRPMRLAEILDQAMRLYRRNFTTFIGIIALVHIPMTILQLGVSYLTTSSINTNATNPSQVFTAGYFLGLTGTIVIGIAQLVLVQGVAAAALTHAVTANFLGERIGILEAYQRIRQSWGKLVLSLILLAAMIFGLSIATFLIPCVGWLIGPGLLVFLSLAVNPLLAPTVIVENLSVGGSLRRAWDLGRRRFWWLLGFIFILMLFSQLVVTGPTVALSAAARMTTGSSGAIQQSLLNTIIAGFVSITFSLLYIPLQLTAHTLVYYDLRIRTEGFDLSLLSLQNAGTQPTIAAIRELPPQSPSANLVEWSDIGNFVIVTLIIVGLYVILFSVLMFIIFGAAALSGL
jgi:hypothetical protein